MKTLTIAALAVAGVAASGSADAQRIGHHPAASATPAPAPSPVPAPGASPTPVALPTPVAKASPAAKPSSAKPAVAVVHPAAPLVRPAAAAHAAPHPALRPATPPAAVAARPASPPPPAIATRPAPPPPVANGSGPRPTPRPAAIRSPSGDRWHGNPGVRWEGGTRAPGGWNGYRRATRGYRLPRYWVSPAFSIGDYGSYGLSQPPAGYSWSRYYNDAVMVDTQGRVWDSISGIDWQGNADDGYGYRDDRDDRGDYGRPDYGTSYAYDDMDRYDRPDREPHRAHRGPPPPMAPYDGAYPPPPGDRYDPAPNVVYSQPSEVVQGRYYRGGYTTSSTTQIDRPGYYSGGHYYPATTTTTITVGAPTVQTTTTEYVTYERKVWKAKRSWRPASKIRKCNCR